MFEYEHNELVFVNENALGFVSIYINGDLLVRKWKGLSNFATDTTVYHNDVEYRFISGAINSLSLKCRKQRITMIVDGSKAQSKVDNMWMGLSKLQRAHALFTHYFVGMVVGFVGMVVGFMVGRVIL